MVVAVVLGARLMSSALPLSRYSTPISLGDVGLVGVGLVGLSFHCAAMFFRGSVEWLPGTDSAITDIRSLGTTSVVWYVIPSALVLLGLRRQHPVALALVTLALVAVGITMYNGGSSQVHLTSIFICVVVLAAAGAALVRRPERRPREPHTGR